MAILARVLEASVTFETQKFDKPLVIGGKPIHDITQAHVDMTVEANGKEVKGYSTIYESYLWGWLSNELSGQARDESMRGLTLDLAKVMPKWCSEMAHPLEHGWNLHLCLSNMEVAHTQPPPLARLICGSPFDAALHDAVGKAYGISAFRFYDEDVPLPTDHFFNGMSTVKAIHRVLSKGTPIPMVQPAWLIVSANDLLDGLDDMEAWVKRGYRCFKLKTKGDVQQDVDLTISFYCWAKEQGLSAVRIAVDHNCSYRDDQMVTQYLDALHEQSVEAYGAVEYIEQPTSRDIVEYPQAWMATPCDKPIVLDEGLVSMETLEEALVQGYRGIAVKTCRGHSFSLLSAAWAHQRSMQLVMQDLTNPGLAAIHAFLMACHLPVANGIELNSIQFTPQANTSFMPRLNSLFQAPGGNHFLSGVPPVGLGSGL